MVTCDQHEKIADSPKVSGKVRWKFSTNNTFILKVGSIKPLMSGLEEIPTLPQLKQDM